MAETKAVIKIEAQTKEAKEQINQLGERVVGLGDNFSKLLEPATLAEGLIGTALVAAAGKCISAFMETVAATKQLSLAYGLNLEQATQLSQAGEKLGVSSEVMSTAMYRLSAEMDNGGKNLQKLGISLRDNEGNLKSQGDLFMEVRDKISNETDTTKQATEAKALFGKQGKELLPILKANKDFLEEEGKSAQELGIAVTEADIERSKAFKAATKDAEDVGLAFMMKFARPLMDALPDIMNTLSDIAAKFLWLADVIAVAIKGALIVLEFFASGLDTIVSLSTIAGLKVLELTQRMTGHGKAAEETAKKAGEEWDKYVAKMEKHNETITKLSMSPAQAASAKEKEGSKELTDFEKKELEKRQADYEKYLESLAQAKKLSLDNAIAAENEAYKAAQENEKLSLEEKYNATVEHTNKINALLKEQADFEIQMAAYKGQKAKESQEQIGAEIVAAQQKQNTQIANNDKAVATQKVALEKATAEQRKKIIADLESSALAKTKEGAILIKGIKITQATMDTYAAANAALASSPPPMNFILAGGVVAAGLANVAQIAGATFADGAWAIPGSGRADNYPAMLAPGEMVLPASIAGTVREKALAGTMGGSNINLGGIIVNNYGNQMDEEALADAVGRKFMNELRSAGGYI